MSMFTQPPYDGRVVQCTKCLAAGYGPILHYGDCPEPEDRNIETLLPPNTEAQDKLRQHVQNIGRLNHDLTEVLHALRAMTKPHKMSWLTAILIFAGTFLGAFVARWLL